jgi:hypothetical protein
MREWIELLCLILISKCFSPRVVVPRISRVYCLWIGQHRFLTSVFNCFNKYLGYSKKKYTLYNHEVSEKIKWIIFSMESLKDIKHLLLLYFFDRHNGWFQRLPVRCHRIFFLTIIELLANRNIFHKGFIKAAWH